MNPYNLIFHEMAVHYGEARICEQVIFTSFKSLPVELTARLKSTVNCAVFIP
jgi:hypothetical protein